LSNMGTTFTEKEIEEIKKIKGEITGDCIMLDFDFILDQRGEAELKKIEDAIMEAGYTVNHKNVKRNSLYPVGALVALDMAVNKIFHYTEKDFEEMGKAEARISSMLIRAFMRYFVSMDMAARQAQRMWDEHYKFGNLEIAEHDKKKRRAVVRIKNFRTHPFLCYVFKGYTAGILGMIIGKDPACKETKCVHKGDEYHEFVLSW
jgi:predicted hydrocarbon binding protein